MIVLYGYFFFAPSDILTRAMKKKKKVIATWKQCNTRWRKDRSPVINKKFVPIAQCAMCDRIGMYAKKFADPYASMW